MQSPIPAIMSGSNISAPTVDAVSTIDPATSSDPFITSSAADATASATAEDVNEGANKAAAVPTAATPAATNNKSFIAASFL